MVHAWQAATSLSPTLTYESDREALVLLEEAVHGRPQPGLRAQLGRARLQVGLGEHPGGCGGGGGGGIALQLALKRSSG